MELKYPESKTMIDDMCKIIKFFGIKKTEYTDCTILYEAAVGGVNDIVKMGERHSSWESPQLV